jgi:hypothetical protein
MSDSLNVVGDGRDATYRRPVDCILVHAALPTKYPLHRLTWPGDMQRADAAVPHRPKGIPFFARRIAISHTAVRAQHGIAKL